MDKNNFPDRNNISEEDLYKAGLKRPLIKRNFFEIYFVICMIYVLLVIFEVIPHDFLSIKLSDY